MSAPSGRPDHQRSAVEPHAQHLPEGGNSQSERATRLGGAVCGAPADVGCSHTRGEPVQMRGLLLFIT